MFERLLKALGLALAILGQAKIPWLVMAFCQLFTQGDERQAGPYVLEVCDGADIYLRL